MTLLEEALEGNTLLMQQAKDLEARLGQQQQVLNEIHKSLRPPRLEDVIEQVPLDMRPHVIPIRKYGPGMAILQPAGSSIGLLVWTRRETDPNRRERLTFVQENPKTLQLTDESEEYYPCVCGCCHPHIWEVPYPEGLNDDGKRQFNATAKKIFVEELKKACGSTTISVLCMHYPDQFKSVYGDVLEGVRLIEINNLPGGIAEYEVSLGFLGKYTRF